MTGNASNNMGAKRPLEEKRPHIFWTSCAAHTINLILQEIGNMPRFKKVVDQAKACIIFAYGHTRTLECLRCFRIEKDPLARILLGLLKMLITTQVEVLPDSYNHKLPACMAHG